MRRLTRLRTIGLMGGSTPYWQRIMTVFGSSVVAACPMNEASETAALDKSGHSYNGVYTGVDLANTPGPYGTGSAPLFGAGDVVNAYSAGLAGAFNGAEGTLITW